MLDIRRRTQGQAGDHLGLYGNRYAAQPFEGVNVQVVFTALRWKASYEIVGGMPEIGQRAAMNIESEGQSGCDHTSVPHGEEAAINADEAASQVVSQFDREVGLPSSGTSDNEDRAFSAGNDRAVGEDEPLAKAAVDQHLAEHSLHVTGGEIGRAHV